MRLILLSVLASLVLVGAYVAAGGASYAPDPVEDPCLARDWREPENLDELGQQLALSGIDGAACALEVSRESLARALASDEDRARFMKDHSITDEEFDDAVRAGLNRMVDDAERAGEIGGLVAAGLRALVRVVPAAEAFELLMDARPLVERALGAGQGLGIPGLEDSLGEQGQESEEGLTEKLRKRLEEGLGGGELDGALDGVRDALEGLRDSLDPERGGATR